MGVNTYVMRIASKKGGVGKTVLAVNLALALGALGEKVLLVDGDPINANITDQLNLTDFDINFSDVLFNKLDATEAIFKYKPGFIDILPGKVYPGVYAPTTDQIRHLGLQIAAVDYKFIIVDSPPGFFTPSMSPFYSESIIVSNPDIPSLNSNMGLVKLYSENEIKNSLVINRVGQSEHELSQEDIESEYQCKVLAMLPEDIIVMRSINEQRPAYLIDPTSKFPVAVKELAQYYKDRT